ncbi:MAG TPA: metal-sensitive transcriptional regulator, partial [Anaerolineales bacterium]
GNKMKLEDPELQEKLAQRLRRIEGQVRGVEAMLSSGRECREIIQQLAAIQSALHGFSRSLLEEYAVNCLLPEEGQPADRQSQERNLRELIDLINKAP